MSDRITRPEGPQRDFSPVPKNGDNDGPKRPDVERPGGKSLLERMKRVEPNMAKKYRQRSGE